MHSISKLGSHKKLACEHFTKSTRAKDTFHSAISLRTRNMYSPQSPTPQSTASRTQYPYPSHVCSQKNDFILPLSMLLRMHANRYWSQYCRGISDELNALRFIGGGGGGFLALEGGGGGGGGANFLAPPSCCDQLAEREKLGAAEYEAGDTDLSSA